MAFVYYQGKRDGTPDLTMKLHIYRNYTEREGGALCIKVTFLFLFKVAI